MQEPLVITLSHSLGRAEARRRIADNIDRLRSHIPGGADVAFRWDGDRLTLNIKAMGQAATGFIDVEERQVRVEVTLPPMLATFAQTIRSFLTRKGGELLEDKSRA